MWRRSLKTILLDAPVAAIVLHKVGCIARVEGESMQPTLNPNGRQGNSDYVFLNKWSVKEFHVSRGQVVALISPKNPDQKLIKRIGAVEGDFVQTSKDELIEIPKGHCWVEGDHLKQSYDSNHFGPVALGLIHARATYILWPPSRWSKIEEQMPKTKVTGYG